MHLASPDNLIPALQSIPSNLTTVIANSKIEQLHALAARKAFKHKPHTHVVAARRNLFVDHLHTLSRSQMLKPSPMSPMADGRDVHVPQASNLPDPFAGRQRTYVAPSVTKDSASRARFMDYLYLDRPSGWPYDWPASNEGSRADNQPYAPHRIPPKGPYGPTDLGKGRGTDADAFVDMFI